MLIVYRMRKADEGSYSLNEPKRSPNVHSYLKAPTREFFAWTWYLLKTTWISLGRSEAKLAFTNKQKFKTSLFYNLHTDYQVGVPY